MTAAQSVEAPLFTLLSSGPTALDKERQITQFFAAEYTRGAFLDSAREYLNQISHWTDRPESDRVAFDSWRLSDRNF
ncbi:hypothetical protein ACIRRA_14240 [Nocardia sp. NPDC101769]|uniref:hypothetical protein n=1 Tax=Nocardia sp. NPDC101769 TaxID=3364333 RepID=UPI00383020C9